MASDETLKSEFLLVYVWCVHMCAIVCACRSEDSLSGVSLCLLPCLRKVSLVCAAAHGLVSGAFPVSTAQCFL